jgi:hypothetical protein
MLAIVQTVGSEAPAVLFCEGEKSVLLTAVGFEPTPRRTGA